MIEGEAALGGRAGEDEVDLVHVQLFQPRHRVQVYVTQVFVLKHVVEVHQQLLFVIH